MRSAFASPLVAAVLAGLNLAGGVAAGEVTAALAPGPGLQLFGATAPADPKPVTPPRAVNARLQGLDRFCPAPSPKPVVDGRSITVSIPPMTFVVGAFPTAAWTAPPSSDAGWQLWFYSMNWAAPIARRAALDGQTRSLTSVVDQVLRFYTEYPDAYPKVKAQLGWDEGTSLRRLETLTCLYAASRDPRLPEAMAKEVAVQSGPRYYGPPLFSVHNHGLMANKRIIVAGRLTGRDDWVRLGQSRLVSEAPKAFSPTGLTYEQSAGYHFLNYSMWNSVAHLLSVIAPTDPTPGRLRVTLKGAQRAREWLTEPDGRLVQLGDTARVPGVLGTGLPGMLRDDQAGYLIGRWSWSDRRTTYYSLRYGPPRWAHGHFDKASLTWTTRGVRVLGGPGFTTGIVNSTALPWHRSPAAHNVALPVGGALNPRGTALLRSAAQKGAVATSVVDDYSHTIGHRRVTIVDDAHSSLNVVDTFAANAKGRQSWHLDPAWRLVSAPANGTVLRFRHPSGKVLTVSTTGRLSGVVRGRTRPFAGWVYDTPTKRMATYEFTIRSTTSRVRTSFSIR